MRQFDKIRAPHEKVAILVLGMHRSGTSLLAGILDCLGCRGPKTPIEANEKNPKGFFESKKIFQLNDEILAVAGTRWDDWQPLHEDWLCSPRFSEFHSRAIELLRGEYEDASMIYLKDPRICRLLPLWRNALEELGYRVVCIHTHRHPIDVAKSLEARKTISVEPSLGMLSWFRHVLEGENISRDLPRVFTSYASLLEDWQIFANNAENTFDLTWPVIKRVAQNRVAQLIDPGLRHHESCIQTFLQDPLIPNNFRETLQILENWAHAGENKGDRQKFDALRHNFDLATPLLFAPISALEEANRDVKALASQKASADVYQGEILSLTNKLTEAEGKHDQIALQQEQLRSELDLMSREIGKAETQGKIDELRIESLTEKLADAESKRDQLSSQREQLRAELDHSRADMENAQTRAQADQCSILSLSEKLAMAEGKHDQLVLQQEQLRADLDQSRSDMEKAVMQAQADKAQTVFLSERLSEAEEHVLKLSGDIKTWTIRTIERDKRIFNLQKSADLSRHAKPVKTALVVQFDDAEKKIGKLEDKLRIINNKHHHEIETLHNRYKTSTSWRISAPLRFIKDWLWR